MNSLGEKIKMLDEVIEKALADMDEKIKSGKKFTIGDIKLIRELKEGFRKGDSEVESGGPSWRYVTPAEAARQLNISERWIRNWLKGTKTCSPALKHKLNNRKKPILRPAEAYEHILKHARQVPANLSPPPRYKKDENIKADDEVEKIKDLNLPSDPKKMLESFLERPELLDSMSSEKIKLLKLIVSELRQIDMQDEKSKQKLTPDEIVKMLKSFVSLFVAIIDERAVANSNDFLSLVASEFNVDLKGKSPIARDIIESRLREHANIVIGLLTTELDSRVHGLTYLENL